MDILNPSTVYIDQILQLMQIHEYQWMQHTAHAQLAHWTVKKDEFVHACSFFLQLMHSVQQLLKYSVFKAGWGIV